MVVAADTVAAHIRCLSIPNNLRQLAHNIAWHSRKHSTQIAMCAVHGVKYGWWCWRIAMVLFKLSSQMVHLEFITSIIDAH